MQAFPPSQLDDLPPDDPRGHRLRRYLPLLALIGGLALMGWIGVYIVSESPTAQKPIEITPSTPQTRPMPSTLAELRDAANRPEVEAVTTNHAPVPAADPELTKTLKAINMRLTALEEVVKAQQQVKTTPAKVDTTADDAARKDALERQKRAEEAAKRKAEEDAAAKKARVIWERKSEKEPTSGITNVTTVNSAYSLMPNWQIPCTIKKAISSQAPGTITAMVRANVYDSLTGQYLLIPQWAELQGTSTGGLAVGDETINASFTKMIVKNKIYGMGSTAVEDVTGQPGLSDQIDRHWGRTLLSVLITPALNVMRSGGSGAAVGGLNDNPGGALMGAAAQQTANIGAQQAQRLLNLSPTITIRQGFLCSMTVLEPISFTKPYSGV